MRHQTSSEWFVMAVILLTVWAGVLASSPARAAEPDFSKVSDILNGQRHLLRIDDLVTLGLRNPLTPSMLATANGSITHATPLHSFPSLPLQDFAGPRLGRMFDLPNDVVAIAAGAFSPDFKIEVGILDPVKGKEIFGAVPTSVDFPQFANSIALADFTGDGYADLVVNCRNSFGRNAIILATAKDVNNVDAGLTWGDDNQQTDEIHAMAVGDFDGDGQLEVFGLIPGTGGTGLRLVLHTFDRKNLTFSDAVHFPLSLPVASNSTIHLFAVAAGRFGSTTHDQLAVVYVTGTDQDDLVVMGIDVDSDLRPIVKSHASVVTDFGLNQLRIASARFDWFGSFDQLAVLVGGSIDILEVFVVPLWAFSSDGKLTPTVVGEESKGIPGCNRDLAVGNFDRMRSNPHPPPPLLHDPSLQLAILKQLTASDGSCSNNFAVEIFNVSKKDDATGFTIAPSSTFDVTPASALAAGDLQGRSLQLGEPSKVTIQSRAQPTVILAAPPMHVDFITPDGTSPPILLNLTAVPGAYFTQYQAEESKRDQSSDQHTTSWSAGLKEQVGVKVTIGNPNVTGGTAEVKFGAQQTWEGSTETINQSYSARTFDVSQQTGFGDQVWFTESRFNLYIYPVIGQRACPDDGSQKPDCPDNQKTPLFVQFSGPDQIHNETIFGPSLEWYQPPWEPGNVFSYPATEAQLKLLFPDLAILSGAPLTWFTDQSVFLEKTTWSSGEGQTQSTSSKQTFSENVSVSVAGQYSFGGAAIGGSFSVSGALSNSTAALNTSQTSIGKSDGIGVQKPGTFADPQLYQYAVTPFIFGQTPPKGNVNEQPSLPTDIRTFGMLRAAFLTDPIDPQAGGWWKQAYTERPDVALNHPSRWEIHIQSDTTPSPNCLPVNPTSQTVQCATLAAARPTDPWLSPFHYMRGLFITNDGAKGQGPQLETATVGDKLVLQARVYNYSLAAMPAGTVVHARFYGQPWDPTNNTPMGDSFLIGEDRLGPIPPFSSDGPLNWLLAHTTFDTTPHGNQYLTFWVIVWMEDSGGLVREIPGHGLTEVPGELTSLAQADALSESHSNNVGFYKSAFYVIPKSSATSVVPKRGKTREGFWLGPVLVSSPHFARGDSVTVSTMLLAGNDDVPGATLLFYDGDPQDGGRLFDLERVTNLRATEYYDVSGFFSSDECGERRLFVVVGSGTPSQRVRQSDPITVDCGP